MARIRFNEKNVGGHSHVGGTSLLVAYVQDERYFAVEHMEEVRPGSAGREAALGYVRREAFQVCTILKKELATSEAGPSYRLNYEPV